MTPKVSGNKVNHNGPIIANEIEVINIANTNYNLLGTISLMRPGKNAHDNK